MRLVLAHEPGNAAYRRVLAYSLSSLGILMDIDQSGRSKGAEHYHKLAIDICEELVKEFPRDDRYRHDLMRDLNNLGTLFQSLGRYADSVRPLVRAQQLARESEAEFPNIPGNKGSLARVCSNLGIAFKETGRLQQAEEAHREALLIMHKLVDCQNGIPGYHSNIGAYSNNLANVVWEQGKLFEARRLLEEAIHHQRTALKMNPREPTYHRFLNNHFNSLTHVLEKIGDIVAAKNVVEDWSSMLLVRGSSSGTPEDEGGSRRGLDEVGPGSGNQRRSSASQYPTCPPAREEGCRTGTRIGLLLEHLGRGALPRR